MPYKAAGYLLVEGQDIDSTLFNTAQVGVIRRGSDLLRQAATVLAAVLLRHGADPLPNVPTRLGLGQQPPSTPTPSTPTE